ncbi:hypothetical protein H4O14_01980 [Bacillus sp. PAMC26568]|nr:hypothetical protein H4O14_01980 [Bacillus sp. PAMC26568]
MKYRFICVLHKLKLGSIKNRGIGVFPGARISNGPNILAEFFNTELMRTTVGVHSLDEFNNTVYFYIDGEFEDINSKEEMDEVGVKYTFFFLRQAQRFALELWKIKDNNIYIRDGFLLVYQNTFENGFTYKASLSEVFNYASGELGESKYSDSEISSVIHGFEAATFEDYAEESFGGKYPDANHFFKNSGYERLDRAIYFTMYARRSAVLPMKIISYCTALECLFTSGRTEINHKIAERVALMLGTSGEEKKSLFKQIKKAYDYRSLTIHGSSLRGGNDDLVEISKGLDNILRRFITEKHEIFSKKEEEIEVFFTNLLFNV